MGVVATHPDDLVPPVVDSVYVSHVVASVRKSAGGPSYSVPRLVEELARTGRRAQLRTLSAPYSENVDLRGCDARFHRPARGCPGRVLSASSDLRNALFADAVAGAILHAHGLWLMPNVYPAWAKRRSRGAAKLVHSPRGMLAAQALQYSTLKKRAFWWTLQRSALADVDCFHATAASEYEAIRAAGLRNPVAIVPNGIDIPELLPLPSCTGKRIALYLGRLHPKKGLERLVRAWAGIEQAFPDWELHIRGPAENGHDTFLRELVRSVQAKRVEIKGPVYGQDKVEIFRCAEIFLLPSISENFGITVAEALASEVPVIATKGTPWAGLETECCGWWVDQGVEPLAERLREAISRPPGVLRTMGRRGRAWMVRDFSWVRVASEMLAVYSWVRGSAERPPSVRIE
jgi:glycosyltransferase involved in cell wall biosynthesis